MKYVTRSCVTCLRNLSRPRPQMIGSLPIEQVTADAVFSRVGVDYAGLVYLKLGAVWRPTVVKAYVAVFVSLTIKAVHLDLVSDLTTESFIACLRHLVVRRGHQKVI